jgi:uncharacterized protein (TIGR03032 family)
LTELDATLFVTTYQAGKLVAIRANGDRLSTLLRTFDRPMGLVAERERLTVGARTQIWMLCNAPEIGPHVAPVGQHDCCFVPRGCHVTGDILIHDLAWSGNDLWMVNTRFSCLCTLHPAFSFVPRWQPAFVTALQAEDRCHLNGLAMHAGRPAFVTALGETDTFEGWRAHKADGGILINVASGAVLARGLSMPHSPRVHAGRLWLLDSGTGRLVTVDPRSGRCDTIAELPGYPRGLFCAGNLAFVGLSQVRESARFGGLPLTERLPIEQRKCGVWVVDLATAQTVATLEFHKGVEEIFAVELLAGYRFPAVISNEPDQHADVFVLPPPR